MAAAAAARLGRCLAVAGGRGGLLGAVGGGGGAAACVAAAAAAAARGLPTAAVAVARAASTTSGGEAVADRRIIRFQDEAGEEHFGAFTDVTETAARVARRGGDGRLKLTNEVVSVDLLLPPLEPPAIFCVGLNYLDHAKEVGMELPRTPIVFMKAINALTGHNSAIVIPAVAADPPEVDYEAELGVVIGRPAKNVSEADAMQYVLGYTIANDVTARRWQGKKGGGQWVRSKSFDTFLPLGPYLIPAADVPNPAALSIRTWVNDTLVQDGSTSQMIFSIPRLIAFLSQDTTLLPGTLILTGTPAGVGYVRNNFLAAGDVVRITIDGLGTLRNPVAQATAWGGIEHKTL